MWTHSFEDGDNFIRDENGKAIACDTSYYPWIDFTEPQWKMVAAAPELLEALEGLLEAAETGSERSSPPGYYDEQIKAARAAIKKAKGE